MQVNTISAIGAAVIAAAATLVTPVRAQTPLLSHPNVADPTAAFPGWLSGFGPGSCKEWDDEGRLHLYMSGAETNLPVMNWLIASDGGTLANVPIPQRLAEALPRIKPCLPGLHHS